MGCWQNSKRDCSQTAVLKITRQISSKRPKCSSKVKPTAINEHQLNRIISNQFANCKIFKVWNDAGVIVSQSTRFQKLYQLGYHNKILILKLLLTFKQKRKYLIWARDLQILKILQKKILCEILDYFSISNKLSNFKRI